METPEIVERTLIALVFLWGMGLKLCLIGYKEDKENGPDTPFHIKYLWRNSNKWRILGSFWFLVGMAYIAPHEGLNLMKEYQWEGVPVGHIGTGAIGFLGDDIFMGLDSVREYAKSKFRKGESGGQRQTG